MEICFIPNNDYASFIKKHSSEEDIIKGKIFHENGTFIGNHEGIHQFTIGQRKGLGFATGEVVYVTRIDANSGHVFVGNESFLFKNGFKFKKLTSTQNNLSSLLNQNIGIKIRYRSKQAGAIITQKSDENTYYCYFHTPQKSVTPGQIAVIYHDNEVLGGGVIDEVF